jgi:hypothetical protein
VTINRREVLVSSVALAGVAASPTAMNATASVSDRRRAVELTFLKSKPGERETLKRFIMLNWFAMDAIAKARGLMEGYTLLEAASEEGPWNIVVQVAYPNERGYDGIVEQFERIRRDHKTVKVDGKTLPELGVIVETRRLFEDVTTRS